MADKPRTYSFDEEEGPEYSGNAADQPRFIYSRSISAAVYLAHRLSVVALILVVLWSLFTNTDELYLGGLNWVYPKVFNWHPIFMVGGMVVCTTEGLLAFRSFPFDKVINRRVRYLWHTLGIALMISGLVAVFMHSNDRNSANMWSLHSWMGVMTIALFLAQYCLGIYLFFNEGADPDMREAYIPFFAWLDILVYVCACFTAEAGIVEKNTELGCTYNVTEIKNYDKSDPAIYYEDLPSGCRVSSGLGITILFMCLCTVYAALELKLPDISSTAAGWEAYKLTVEEQLRRGTWCDYFYSFWPFGVKKKRSQRTREERQAARQQGNRNGGGGGGGGGRGKKNNWVEKNDGNGVYYYNTKTNESTKVKPPEL